MNDESLSFSQQCAHLPQGVIGQLAIEESMPIDDKFFKAGFDRCTNLTCGDGRTTSGDDEEWMFIRFKTWYLFGCPLTDVVPMVSQCLSDTGGSD